MSELIRITCPPTELPKEQRIAFVYEDLKKWLCSQSMNQLVCLYNNGKQTSGNLTFSEYILWMREFAGKHWDYRKMQKEAMTKEGEAARWLLQNDSFAEENKDTIYEASKALGLIGVSDTFISDPDYILPLGGARMSNLRRCELARRIVDKHNMITKVVALSTYRPIAESERDTINTYAQDSQFEFDAIVEGLNSAFGMQSRYNIVDKTFENANNNYAICTFGTEYNGSKVFALAAPSTLPETRRANSADCFEFFFKEFNVQKGARIINCTSQIYCTYQHIKALCLAIKYNVVFDTVGFPFYLNEVNASSENSLSKPVNYLQEIKATIDAMYDFSQTFA